MHSGRTDSAPPSRAFSIAGTRGRFAYAWSRSSSSKLIISWLVGARDMEYSIAFVNDARQCIVGRTQLTTDGHQPYIAAMEDALSSDVDYAVLPKIDGTDAEGDKRYSPAKRLGVRCETIQGDPTPKHISTSYVDRSNLTMRMHKRRFTRLTNRLSKKFENHVHMVALCTVFYNWTKIHKTLRVTPAMAAGLTDRLWSMEDVVALID